MDQKSKQKKYGWIWIIISPILLLMAAISTVESITTYYIQFVIISIIAIIGFVSGIATLFKYNWAYVALRYLSWISFVYYSGSGLVMFAYSVPLLIKGNFGAAAMVFSISFGVLLTGLPFYYMAIKWR